MVTVVPQPSWESTCTSSIKELIKAKPKPRCSSPVVEQVAKMAYIAKTLNPSLTMNPLLVEKHYMRKHGPNAYYGQKK